MKQLLLLCHFFSLLHQLDPHKAEVMQLEIRSELQKIGWQNGNDVLSAAGTHWYWNEACCWQVGPSKQWQSCIVEQWEALWHVIQCLAPIQISKSRLSCIQLGLITLGLQPSVPLLRPDEEMCPTFVSNSACTLKNLGPTIMDMWRACLIYQHFNFVTGLITFLVHLSIALHYLNRLLMDFYVVLKYPSWALSVLSGSCHRGSWFPWILSTFVDDYQPKSCNLDVQMRGWNV